MTGRLIAAFAFGFVAACGSLSGPSARDAALDGGHDAEIEDACPDVGAWACTVFDAGPPDTYDPYCQDMIGDVTVCVGTGMPPTNPRLPDPPCEGPTCLK